MKRVSKLFSFVSWSRNHPNEPQPGDALDAEFTEHRNAINALGADLDQIRRSDGALQNEIVTKESLAPSLAEDLARDFRAEIQSDVHKVDTASNAIAAIAHDMSVKHDAAVTAAHRAESAAAILDRESGSALAQIRGAELAATQSLNDANALAARVSNDENHALQSAAVAEDWANVSHAWAEYLNGNDPIPPNILAIMGITGDHWSSRWWANHAADIISKSDDNLVAADGILDDFLKRYIGPHTTPPTVDGKGRPLELGALFWSLAHQELYVWTGAGGWVSISTGFAPGGGNVANIQELGTADSLYVHTVGQTAFFRTIRFASAYFQTNVGPEELSVALKAVPWSLLTNKPTTIAGFGITDAYTKTQIDGVNAAQNSVILTKADKTYVDAKDSSQDSAIATKVDKSYVDSALSAQATKDANQDTVIGTKADKTYVDNRDAAITSAWSSAFNSFTNAQLGVDAAQDSAINLRVPQTGATGAAVIPAGNTAQRPANSAGLFRFNSETGKFEGNTGSAWGNIGGAFYVGDSAPANPANGDPWWNSSDGNLYVYYDDGNTKQWVAACPSGEGQYATKGELDAVKTDAAATYSPKTHNHTGVYSPSNHNHDGVYSPSNHNHDGVYLSTASGGTVSGQTNFRGAWDVPAVVVQDNMHALYTSGTGYHRMHNQEAIHWQHPNDMSQNKVSIGANSRIDHNSGWIDVKRYGADPMGFIMDGNGNLCVTHINSVVGSFANASGVYSPVSDGSRKSGVRYASDGWLEKVKKLAPATYDIEGRACIGLIAQDVQKVFPEFVSEVALPDETFLTLDYASLTAPLVGAVVELAKTVDGLSAKLAAAEARVAALETK